MKNPYEQLLLLASKQAALTLAEIGKMIGKPIAEINPALDLLKAISAFERWNKDNPQS